MTNFLAYKFTRTARGGKKPSRFSSLDFFNSVFIQQRGLETECYFREPKKCSSFYLLLS
jgi:hypothetical protein